MFRGLKKIKRQAVCLGLALWLFVGGAAADAAGELSQTMGVGMKVTSVQPLRTEVLSVQVTDAGSEVLPAQARDADAGVLSAQARDAGAEGLSAPAMDADAEGLSAQEAQYIMETSAPVASQLFAQSAVLMDAASGRVLYEKNGNEVLSMASTTKIVTCIVALENADLDETVSVSAYAASMPKVKMYIKKGEHYKLGDLLYSLMLESHNDVAVAIAEHVGQSFLEKELQEKDIADFTKEESQKAVAAFAALMNEKAAQLGCENTWFITPNGLDATETFYVSGAGKSAGSNEAGSSDGSSEERNSDRSAEAGNSAGSAKAGKSAGSSEAGDSDGSSEMGGSDGSSEERNSDRNTEAGNSDGNTEAEKLADTTTFTRRHSTTATELARLMSYCVLHSPQKEKFLEITGTPSYTVTSLEGRNSFCSNHNAFLNMMEGAFSGKTGFTNQAGYCYTGALERDGRTYVVALLACGWPNNKSYKWSDSKKLFTYGADNFSYQEFAQAESQIQIPDRLPVTDAQTPYIGQAAYVPIVRVEAEAEGVGMFQIGETGLEGILLASDEKIEVKYQVVKGLQAPVQKGDVVGTITYEVDGVVYKREDVVTVAGIEKIDLEWCFEQVLDGFFGK